MIGVATPAETLAGFEPADVPPPKIAESSGAKLVGFVALRGGRARFSSGCVETPIPGWIEDDMLPPVEARTAALVSGASERLRGGEPVNVRSQGRVRSSAAHVHEGAQELRDADDLDVAVGSSRTFIGFGDGSVLTCFAVCVRQSEPGDDPRDCRAALEASRLAGSGPPPPPGLALRAVGWAVHHPRETALAGAAGLVVLGILAVITRRKTRSRPFL